MSGDDRPKWRVVSRLFSFWELGAYVETWTCLGRKFVMAVYCHAGMARTQLSDKYPEC